MFIVLDSARPSHVATQLSPRLCHLQIPLILEFLPLCVEVSPGFHFLFKLVGKLKGLSASLYDLLDILIQTRVHRGGGWQILLPVKAGSSESAK